MEGSDFRSDVAGCLAGSMSSGGSLRGVDALDVAMPANVGVEACAPKADVCALSACSLAASGAEEVEAESKPSLNAIVLSEIALLAEESRGDGW